MLADADSHLLGDAGPLPVIPGLQGRARSQPLPDFLRTEPQPIGVDLPGVAAPMVLLT